MRIDHSPTRDIIDTFPELRDKNERDSINDLIKKLKKEHPRLEDEILPLRPYEELLLDYKRVTQKRDLEVVESTDNGFILRVEKYGEEEPIYSIGGELVYRDPLTLALYIGIVEEIWQHEKYVDYTVSQLTRAYAPNEYTKAW